MDYLVDQFQLFQVSRKGLLFLLYINDITASVNSAIRLYADDVLIYRVIDPENDCKMTLIYWNTR